MRILALVLGLSFAAGCDTSPGAVEPPSPVAEVQTAEAELAVGEATVLEGIPIRFDRVTGDSRCPHGAVCVWEGEATLDVTAAGAPLHLTLRPYRDPDEAAVPVPGVVASVTAVALVPYPDVAVADPPPPVLTVRVHRLTP